MNSTTSEKPEISLMKKILIRVRYGLTLQTIRSILMKIGIEFTPFYIFQEGVYTMDNPEIHGTITDFSIEILESSDMKILGNVYVGFSEKGFLALLEAGEKCIGLKHKDELAAFMWINFKELRYKATVINLKSNEAYLWFMHTMESYRGKNLAPYLRYKSYEMLKEMDRNVLYSISDCFNSPAVRFKEKLNAKKREIILFIKLFNLISWCFTLKSYKC